MIPKEALLRENETGCCYFAFKMPRGRKKKITKSLRPVGESTGDRGLRKCAALVLSRLQKKMTLPPSPSSSLQGLLLPHLEKRGLTCTYSILKRMVLVSVASGVT